MSCQNPPKMSRQITKDRVKGYTFGRDISAGSQLVNASLCFVLVCSYCTSHAFHVYTCSLAKVDV